jgi:3-oxoacyl-ACP reductase-like protein
MKCFLFFLLTTMTSFIVHAQDSTELIRRNGFKTIHLGTSVDSVKGAMFKKEIKEKDEFPARLYKVDNDELKMIGEVRVKEIHIKTYQNLIYEINVTTEKDERVIRALEKSFGKAKYVLRDLSWNWGASPLSLRFVSHKGYLDLTYRSHPVVEKMYADKGKKLDAIAEGF